MTKTQIGAAVAAILLATVLVASVAPAQQAMPANVASGAPMNVALLDVNYIFKQHLRFKAKMDEMKVDFERARDELKKQAASLQAMEEQLRKFRPGTIEYKQTEESIAKTRADISVQAQLQQKEFLQREASMNHSVWLEIQQEVQYYCAQHNVVAVIRFDGETVDKDKPDDILREINQQVIWYNPAVDITPHILARLNQASGAAPSGVPAQAYRPGTQGIPFPQR